jgi:pimeloyl-ACP methyl ester carboxylesterase
VLVHGVGFGPGSVAPLARALRDRGARVLVVERRGYGSRAALAPATSVAVHVDDVVAAMDAAAIDHAVVAGMSGGATVALAMAISRPDRLVRAVAHEPAVGALVPALGELVRGALSAGGGGALARALAGPDTWAALSDEERDDVLTLAALIERDAPAFLAFDPRLDRAVGERLVCTVGALSSPLRHRVAAALAERTGAPVLTVPGCAHLPQYDAPDAFADTIRALAAPAALQETASP